MFICSPYPLAYMYEEVVKRLGGVKKPTAEFSVTY